MSIKSTVYKTLLIAIVAAFAASVSAQDTAQREQKTAREMATTETETALDRLENLTSKQAEKLMEINLNFFEKKKELKDRQATDEEFKPLYKEREDSVKVILNLEQFNTWKESPEAKKVREKMEEIEVNRKNNL